MTALAIVQSQPQSDLDALTASWLNSLAPNSRAAYTADLAVYAEWREMSTREAVAELLGMRKPLAEDTATAFINWLGERGQSCATVARRRAALCSLVKRACEWGLIEWMLTVPLSRSHRPRSSRDLRGPSPDDVQKMLDAARTNPHALKAARDAALVWVLFCLALRRAEIARLDIADFDGSRLWIVGKGHTDKEPMTVPPQAAESLRAYIALRGAASGPMFVCCDNAHAEERLTTDGIYAITKSLAERAGVIGPVSPHRFRHSGTTEALNLTNGDVRRVRKLTRHASIETLLLYDDARRDDAGAVARMLADRLR